MQPAGKITAVVGDDVILVLQPGGQGADDHRHVDIAERLGRLVLEADQLLVNPVAPGEARIRRRR